MTPLFGAFHALAIHDAGGWAGLATSLFPAFHIQRVMHLLQCAIPAPQAEIAVHRAARRQVLRDVTPLTASAEHIHHAVDHFAHVDSTFTTATLGRRDQWPDLLPLRIGKIAGIA